ncbi:hypothetical protein C1J03_19585 [Sulfitobacter sp. SK012]|uniref:M10 family metallopeptidase C-terminal domain-containing protein n=1 Tax=Sulfitobacter sp. SK012 TaxID=1389005 RepID=UPI000E0A897B|nr:matrixin family metalloprotease [Sulfitobacter sp. SK012]AXI48007.1 hypothetical protein C1J03_19585 [Sulfitobacter sp. SK012]
MCTMCFQLPSAPDGCAFEVSQPVFARLREGNDAADGVNTAYTMSVGDSFSGSIDFNGDDDWIAINLVSGRNYTISLDGVTLNDTYLRLYDDAGSLVDYNDDANGRLDSELSFRLAYPSGTYYISAEAYSSFRTGSYELSVTGGSTPPQPPTGGAASLDTLANFLTEGYWGGRERSFSTVSDNIITVDIGGLTSSGRELARWAFEAWERVADIDFREVSFNADIEFDDFDDGAYANSQTSGGRITSSFVNVSTDWLRSNGTSIDSYSFQTYVHEIGHALGLGHQGDYNSNATYGFDENFRNDSWAQSVMSYFDQDENTFTSASFARLSGPMIADILAIQNLYGAADAGSATAGNTVYGQGTTLDGYMGTLFDALASGRTNSDYTGEPIAFAISDAGGIDRINLTYLNGDQYVDLRQQAFSNIAGLRENMSIARGTTIENLNLGNGNDTVYGNDASNILRSGGGSDLLFSQNGSDRVFSGVGNDTAYGGAGNDVLNGEAGFDQMWGGNGNDYLTGGAGNDVLGGGGGNDTLDGGIGADSLYAGGGDDRLLGRDGNDNLWTSYGNDTVSGGNGNDEIGGGFGNDNLYAGTGNDLVYGGFGNDVIYGGTGRDQIFAFNQNDFVDAGEGNDIVYLGRGNDTGRGGQGDDAIYGASGNDIIAGGGGNDTLTGGTGNDTFIFTGGDDRIADFNASSALERIDFSGYAPISSFADLRSNHLSSQGSNVLVNGTGGDSLLILGVNLNELDAGDFVF